MATNVIDHLRRAVLLREGAGLGDGELLGCFIERHDEAALATLVKRHGPMVWGVCRRLLSHHDAEDAFQATFIVLVRKAASIVPRAMVGNWLYGVAHQTALQARRTATRQRAREVQVTAMPDTAIVQPEQWPDVGPLLDQELSRLPDNYRAVVVLCDLEGRTRKEVARQLGVPEGTVAGRLPRARAMLAKRLAQRGVTLSGAALAAVLSQSAVSASVSISLVSTTIQAATLVAVGQTAMTGAISVKVAALTEGVLKAMVMCKLKAVVAVLLVLGFMATGTSVLCYRTAAAQDDKKPIGSDKAAASVRHERVFRDPSLGRPGGRLDPTLNKLATGELELEINAEERRKTPPRDLGKIEPPGGVPLFVGRKGEPIRVDGIEKARARLEAVPAEDLERWVVELERIIDKKLKDGLPSARQVCRTDFVVHLSVAFDDLKWNAKTAANLFKRAQTMPATEAKVWKEAFEALLKKEIGQTDTTIYAGGPAWAVPLVLIPLDALHEGQKYSAERGKKYLARLKQLIAEDVSLWKDQVDQFGGTKLDAAVNIILLDEFFDKERFQWETFKAAIQARKK
jgi:RNA polymerase sigma factor (sigma-70 family)